MQSQVAEDSHCPAALLLVPALISGLVWVWVLLASLPAR
jgi:hypothetical protein